MGAASAGAALASAGLSPAAFAAGFTPLGPAVPFDFARLQARARGMAAAAWQPPAVPLPPAVAELGVDAYQAIRFRTERALGADEGLRLQVKLFHLGGLDGFIRRRVRMHELRNGQAQEIAYDPALFDYGASGLDGSRLPRDMGFAGLSVALASAPRQDMVAFLGATAFRAVGATRQYGLSARGLAVNTAGAGDEEFPDFTNFWIERPDARAPTVVLYALLDSPSIAGAYRFTITPGDTTVVEVDTALYPRREIDRIGIAPCTSMFLAGENSRQVDDDWRQEVHDSDGLSMNTGAGEWIWRPLRNPSGTRYNAFADNNPRGFGLLQRDRNFDHYQDDEAAYERRPSLWVEPKGAWGAGQVQLIEMAADNDAVDNVIAFWRPAQKPRPGQELLLGYRLHWGAEPPAKPPLARCIATRTGVGGGEPKRRTRFAWRFVVDFAGGRLAQPAAPADAPLVVEVLATASRGAGMEVVASRALASARGWRAIFDVTPPDEGSDPIILRLRLRAGGQPLSETWVYEWSPPAAGPAAVAAQGV
jgi:glucans biosynthesis protein